MPNSNQSKKPRGSRRDGEEYIPQYKMYVAGFSSSPSGVEWMRFEADCPLPQIIQRLPHVAFELDALEAALQGREVLFPPGVPSEGVRAAMLLRPSISSPNY